MDPFHGLETCYRQEKYFREKLNLIVSNCVKFLLCFIDRIIHDYYLVFSTTPELMTSLFIPKCLGTVYSGYLAHLTVKRVHKLLGTYCFLIVRPGLLSACVSKYCMQ